MDIGADGMSLTSPERTQRLADIVTSVDAADVDATLITNRSNIRWLRDIDASNATIIIRDDVTLITDFRYAQGGSTRPVRSLAQM